MPAPDKATLLFVDDEERIVRSLKMLFRRDYHVFTATEGAKAIELVKREKIHVVVSDQRMPQMLGVELLRAIRETSPNTMRLLLTGYSDLDAIIDSINEGEIFRYINKPWDPSDLRDIVAKAADIAMALDAAGSFDKPGEKTPESGGVLVIDENPETYEMVQEVCVKEVGGKVDTAWAGDQESVFRILAERPISVVITDLQLTGVDTPALIKSLKQHYPELLCIVLTSFKDTNILKELVNQAQVHRYLPKPGSRHQLSRGIRSALQRHNLFRRRPEQLRQHEVEVRESPETRGISAMVVKLVKRLRSRPAPRD